MPAPSLSLLLATTLFTSVLVAACAQHVRPATGAESAATFASAPPKSVAPLATSLPVPSGASVASVASVPSARFAPRAPTNAPPGPMKLPVATAMGADLQSLGLDLAKLPPLSKLEGEKLRRVMKLFTRSLGVKCSDCHTADFAASTPMKNIAERMWDDVARRLAMQGGEPIFCDSCHQGHAAFLDRHDKKSLGAWMDEAYVTKLTRRDGAEHECATCHGDPFEGEFLKEWSLPRATQPARR
jgi:hypothetical protein